MSSINENTTSTNNDSGHENAYCGQEVSFGSIREQIFANATVLFPQIVQNSVTYTRTGVFDPQELFQVITTSSGSKYTAILVCGVAVAKSAVAQGPEADCAVEALAGLLKTLSEAMGWYTGTLLGEIESSEDSENGGQVNFGMVEDGFHYASVQRWAESNKRD
ncbi:hypothetical protein AC578_945 [Pseudocercospora eumusae]|uniref:Uncharacterized protein n=1 Tax=Pseudocercospora eumusae TaxID=321146 RepID=A0A139HEF0_9PEZI|nr:hypothetical protein AC578_945 [Pseudocercospora eumusae]